MRQRNNFKNFFRNEKLGRFYKNIYISRGHKKHKNDKKFSFKYLQEHPIFFNEVLTMYHRLFRQILTSCFLKPETELKKHHYKLLEKEEPELIYLSIENIPPNLPTNELIMKIDPPQDLIWGVDGDQEYWYNLNTNGKKRFRKMVWEKTEEHFINLSGEIKAREVIEYFDFTKTPIDKYNILRFKNWDKKSKLSTLKGLKGKHYNDDKNWYFGGMSKEQIETLAIWNGFKKEPKKMYKAKSKKGEVKEYKEYKYGEYAEFLLKIYYPNSICLK